MLRVEIDRFFSRDYGVMKGLFDMVLHADDIPGGLKFYGCTYYEKGDQRWVNLPSRALKKDEQMTYEPMSRFLDKTTYEKVMQLAVEAIKKFPAEEIKSAASTRKIVTPPPRENVQKTTIFDWPK